ncbi:hypothetical protein J6590_056485 [Homalodisca vitripennis]|nr:hypothetical protein J6590_056485 [Homalodisca vitripennis]
MCSRGRWMGGGGGMTSPITNEANNPQDPTLTDREESLTSDIRLYRTTRTPPLTPYTRPKTDREESLTSDIRLYRTTRTPPLTPYTKPDTDRQRGEPNL